MTQPEPNFDRVAALYRWAEYLALGPLLQRTRTALLPQLSAPHRVLVLGDGDGRFLEQLLLRFQDCDVLAVDTSAAMLERLRRRCERSSPKASTRLRTLRQNMLTVDAPADTDLVVTHFVLDCLSQNDVDSLVARLAPRLTTGGLWLVSDFALPANRLLRPVGALYIRALYLAFRILTGLRNQALPDPGRSLDSSGFVCIARRTFLCGLLYTELWRHR